MAEVEIGIGKTARRAFRLDEVAIVPSRRTRDPEDVDVACEIDAYRFEMPILGAPTDSVVSPATAIELGRLGFCRGPPPRGPVDPLRAIPSSSSTRSPSCRRRRPPDGCRRSTPSRSSPSSSAPASPRSRTPASPVRWPSPRTAPSSWPTRCSRPSPTCSSSRPRSCRPSTSPRTTEPLNLKAFIRHYELPVLVGGCTSYQAALHLMRTGAAGVLVGAGSGADSRDPRPARRGRARWPPRWPTPAPPGCATSTRPASTAT